MVSIKAQNLSLVYPVRKRLVLSQQNNRRKVGGRFRNSGSSHFVSVLENVSFELEAGDRLGLIGPNGAGKTTLLKVLYGIFEPSGGSLTITGRVDALFNMHLGFRPEATGRRNILLRGLINGWREEEIEARMGEIIEFSELGNFIDMPFKTYSQGMGARLAFSVATALEPEILLMDEWISAGDLVFQRKARWRMNKLSERAGIVILASHNYGLLREFCNKALILEDGTGIVTNIENIMEK